LYPMCIETISTLASYSFLKSTSSKIYAASLASNSGFNETVTSSNNEYPKCRSVLIIPTTTTVAATARTIMTATSLLKPTIRKYIITIKKIHNDDKEGYE
jgi:hypothetical protein